MKTLALDIGGVCITLHQLQAYQALGVNSLEEMPQGYIDAVMDYNCGRIDSDGFCSRMRFLTHGIYSDEQIQAKWNLFLGKEIPETTQLIRELLARKWRVVFFSDIQPWHAEKIPGLVPFFDEAAGRIYSYEVGNVKPNAPMYEAFEAAWGRPDLYLDDRLDNVEAGLTRGWPTLQYTVEVGKRLLAEMSCLPREE